VRSRSALLVLAAVATACTRAPISEHIPVRVPGELDQPPHFSTHAVSLPTAPSPLMEVQSGHVRAVIPGKWNAQPLPLERFAQEGFVASPRIEDWQRGVPAVQGMEAFWVDGARMEIPSDYYYLAARAPTLGNFLKDETCEPFQFHVVADHPPDVTGAGDSPGDFVAQATGSCSAGVRSTKWAYVVVAPGFGPVRQVGIPSSGMYVVVVVVSGPRMKLLDEMVSEASFGGAHISDFMRAASRFE
jgi:hypothetical protein